MTPGLDEAGWDARYSESDRIWSGNPNGGLVDEVSGMTPGTVLDVGCGEGADAVWLAQQGWQVTALEVSGVALGRARQHAADAGVEIAWVHSGLADAALEPGFFDLVSAQYPALPRTDDAANERALLDAVAPGGTLLLIHHAGMEHHEPHDDQPFDPRDFVWPSMVAELLRSDDAWRIDVDETRPRTIDGGAGSHHADDTVLRATRLR
jgi:SAM-dependent methyltransferase